MNFKIKGRDLSDEIKRLNMIEYLDVDNLPQEVTRALEPTHSKEQRESTIRRIHDIQRTLNRKKNLYTKILKELLKSTN